MFTEPKNKNEEDLYLYNWQCVSLMRRDTTTLDLIIKDNADMMVFLNVVQQAVYRPALQNRLNFFKLQKFKMVLAYMAW